MLSISPRIIKILLTCSVLSGAGTSIADPPGKREKPFWRGEDRGATIDRKTLGDLLWNRKSRPHATSIQEDGDKRLSAFVERVDAIEKHVEEWGHASVSNVVLIEDTSKSFDIGEGQSFKELYSELDTSRQGAASINRQRETAIRANARHGQSDNLALAEDAVLDQAALNNEIELLRREALLEEANAALAEERLMQERRIEEIERAAEENRAPDFSNIGTLGDDGPSIPAGDATTISSELFPSIDGASNILPGGQDPATSGLPPSPIAGDTETPNLFTKPQGLITLPDSGLKLSPSEKVRIAGSAYISQQIIRQMTSLNSTVLSGNKRAFLGLTQVSLNPGWRTRDDYICEVQVRPEYSTTRKRIEDNSDVPLYKQMRDELTDENTPINQLPSIIRAGDIRSLGALKHPQVFAAFPLTEAQVLDLRSSDRRQVALLLSAAAQFQQAGQQAAADLLVRHIGDVRRIVRSGG